MTTIGTVSSLNRYPVKSMLGDSPAAVDVDANGIVGDRTWALRDAESGKLVSAKRPRLWADALACQATGTGADVRVTTPVGDTYGITDPGLRVALGALFGREISVEESVEAQQGSYESDWPEIEGITLAGEMDFATNLFGEGTSFIDVGILHLLTTSSMAALAAADPAIDVDQRRFRPSIVLDTADALDGFVENDWEGRTLVIGDPAAGDRVEITVGGPAPRCIMTTLGQPATGDGAALARQAGVLRAIASANRLSNDLGTFACLGAYATVARPGRIQVGHTVTLV